MLVLMCFIFSCLPHVAHACGGTFTGPAGVLQSPAFPSNYSDNLECVYVIRRPAGERITLTFHDMDLEGGAGCPSDFIEIRDGDFDGAPYLGRFCETSLPSPKRSFQNFMWVRFVSDASITGSGFNASYTSDVLQNAFSFLVASSNGLIFRMDAETLSNIAIPDLSLINPIAVDYDSLEGRIYWTDVVASHIASAYINGSDSTVVRALSPVAVPDGIAVDSSAQLVFYTDTGNDEIAVMSTNGSSHRVIISTGLLEPRAIVLDPGIQVMFWTDWGTNVAKIERANYDGSDRRTLHQQSLVLPNALALDLENNHLYWVDAYTDVVELSDLEGNSRRVLYRFNGTHFFGLAYHDGNLYTTDWSGIGSMTAVSYIHRLATDRQTYDKVASAPFRMNDIHVFPEDSTMSVRHCPALLAPHKGNINCSADNVEGSVCAVSCQLGYKVLGQANLTCLHSELWDAPIPLCEAIICPEPAGIDNGAFVCSNGHQYPASCTLTCDPGFLPQNPADIHCYESATWSRAGSCVDVEPPQFRNGCPSDVHTYAAPLGQDTVVNWTPPDAIDNSMKTVLVTSDITSGMSFLPGVTSITYTASDVSGNNVTCSFNVTVTALSCGPPDLETTTQSFMTYDCPNGYVYGASCALVCPLDYRLVGEDSVTCNSDFSTHPPTLSWDLRDPSAGRPQCKEDTCPSLAPPKNGALACFLGDRGQDCLMSCEASWDIPVRTTGYFYCLNSLGVWNVPNVPDCVVPRRPNKMLLQADLFYLTGSCVQNSDDYQQNFITRVSKAVVKDLCVKVPSCVAKNIQVTCGTIADRRKRDSNNGRQSPSAAAAYGQGLLVTDGERSADGDLGRRLHRVRRETGSAASHYLHVIFHLHLTPGGESLTTEQSYQRFLFMKQTLYAELKSQVQNGRLNVPRMTANEASVGQPSFHLDCPPGTMSRATNSPRRLHCTGCGAGHYMREGSTRCEACQVGSYTELDNATSCTPCPRGSSTPSPGSQSSSDCEES